MSISGKLRHWFTPHVSNNFRAKILHNSGIFFVIAIILSSNLLINLLSSSPLHILGFSSSITIDEVVRETNAKRVAAGLSPLTYNEKLADAARRKADNMFKENYWAHFSPSGKSPWYWFGQAGYKYTFAGENLAKDFGSTGRMMDAWMASPTHKENIVNSKYREIGIAVIPGTLQGSETVLVVQLFGTSAGSGGTVAASATPVKPVVAEVKSTPVASPTSSPAVISATEEEVAAIKEVTTEKISQFSLKKYVSLGLTALFILVLVLDLVIAESKALSRRVGKNWAHIVFINVVLLAATLISAGSIK